MDEDVAPSESSRPAPRRKAASRGAVVAQPDSDQFDDSDDVMDSVKRATSSRVVNSDSDEMDVDENTIIKPKPIPKKAAPRRRAQASSKTQKIISERNTGFTEMSDDDIVDVDAAALPPPTTSSRRTNSSAVPKRATEALKQTSLGSSQPQIQAPKPKGRTTRKNPF